MHVVEGKSIFISRNLDDYSPFNALRHNHLIHDNSLLEFETIFFEAPLPSFDWIFFYSQRGVRHFFEQCKDANTLLEDKKVAAFGPKTAKALETIYPRVHFIGTGYADQTAPAFLLLAQGEKVIFPRAKQSLQSMQKALANRVESLDLVVYDNSPKKVLKIPSCDILIFTSPLNARTYFHVYDKLAHQQVIAIGHTTAATIRSLGINDVFVPKSPNESALAQLVQQMDSAI